MKSLKHNGIYVPSYDYKGFNIKIRSQKIKLTPKSEQMAIAWIRKEQSILSPPDEVFKKNFMQEFLEQLRNENASIDFPKHKKKDFTIDFSEVLEYLEIEKQKKLNLTQAEKKKQTAERKAIRLKRKEKYGYAEVNGHKLEIANWTAEPSCLFAGRGNHPRRGKWKEGPREEDITLNLIPPKPQPPGNWKGVVSEPNKMYVAKWTDKLTGKIKYVWFSDSAFLKQSRDKEKFKKAEKLGRHIKAIERYIISNLDAKNKTKRKIATVCWLILKPNMRVGDEKDPDEADTVGAITLRAEHIKIEGETLHFDFLGKDSVRWEKSIRAPAAVIRNLKVYSENCKEYLFEGVDSRKVSRFLSQKMPGLTAKVFRTWRCTKTLKEELAKKRVTKEDPFYLKKFHAKIANLKVAEVANHKRKVSPKFAERLAKKEKKLKEMEAQLKQKKTEGRKTVSIETRIEKAKLDITLTKRTKEYNLSTSLKSYIDPKAYVKWARKVDFNLEKFYPAALRRKFSWALQDKTSETECAVT
ncbi:MAG: DNA topoisomerase I [Candidatus Bathyarchaeota archaeon]|nr:DNA topoisomerase I [Candidatus Bathyarchaeota archaeon]